MFSKFFILRPVLSIVISVVILIAGLVSMYASPIEQYPNIVPPTINISANFPGANAETIANAVAAPIEDQMSGVPGMLYMQSSSSNGSSSVSLNVYFEVGTDIKSIEADALNRVNTAYPQLPTQVQAQGIIMRLKSPDLFQIIPFYSESGNPNLFYISNYVQRFIYPQLLQIPGVGVVSLFGARQFSMRIWLDPNKMAYYKVNVNEIANAIKDQNWPWAIGENAMEPMAGSGQKYNYLINSPGYLTNESQFKNIVIRANLDNTQVVRIKDIATVKLDPQNYNTFLKFYFRKHGKLVKKDAVTTAIYLTPGANQLVVKKQINNLLTNISAHLPAGIKYFYHYDSSEFVLLSINAVIQTLIIAFLLVFLVVILFIQNIRGTFIPIIVIPISIIGTFAGNYILNVSINTLSLFGMVLAIGIVVDDAIVVLENVYRIMSEEKLNSLDASIKSMQEVASPVIAVVAVLNAVFIPVTFINGFSGVLMKQFAATVAISTILSGIVALTLTPALCAILLKNFHDDKPSNSSFITKFFNSFNKIFDKFKRFYVNIVHFFITHIKTGLFLWAITVLCVIMLVFYVPTSLIPLEDQGYFYTVTQVNKGGSFHYNIDVASTIAEKMMNINFVSRIGQMSGVDLIDNATIKTDTTSFLMILNPYDLRPKSNQSVDNAISIANTLISQNKQLKGIAFNQPPIRGLSPTGGVTFYLQANETVTVKKINDDSIKLVKYLMKNYPKVAFAKQFYNLDTPEINIDLDADKLYLYKLTYADAFNTMQSIFGTYYVNYFTKWEDLWWVILQADYKFRKNPHLLNNIYIKNSDGKMVPLGSVIKIKYTTGADVVTRINDFLASQIIVNPYKGHTSGEIMDIIREAVPKVLGKDYTIAWFGPSYQENLAGNTSTIALVLGVLMVYLILCSLYEMWSLPLVIIMSIPFALFGAFFALFIFKMPNDLYFKVSMLTLIGLSAKNSILISEFALHFVKNEGKGLVKSAIEAASIRFRPIIMTSLAFMVGAIPLTLAGGAGANAQHSVGIGIIGGMIGSTFISTIFTPMFFVLIMKIFNKDLKG